MNVLQAVFAFFAMISYHVTLPIRLLIVDTNDILRDLCCCLACVAALVCAILIMTRLLFKLPPRYAILLQEERAGNAELHRQKEAERVRNNQLCNSLAIQDRGIRGLLNTIRDQNAILDLPEMQGRYRDYVEREEHYKKQFRKETDAKIKAALRKNDEYHLKDKVKMQMVHEREVKNLEGLAEKERKMRTAAAEKNRSSEAVLLIENDKLKTENARLKKGQEKSVRFDMAGPNSTPPPPTTNISSSPDDVNKKKLIAYANLALRKEQEKTQEALQKAEKRITWLQDDSRRTQDDIADLHKQITTLNIAVEHMELCRSMDHKNGYKNFQMMHFYQHQCALQQIHAATAVAEKESGKKYASVKRAADRKIEDIKKMCLGEIERVKKECEGKINEMGE